MRVGEVASVMVDAAFTRVIGLDVLGPGGIHRFLPWVAADVVDDGVSVRSSFLLVDDGDSYVRHGARQLADAAELGDLRADRGGWLVPAMRPVSALRATGTSAR